ncbi:hypothetical protein [Lysobacter gummosus]
MLEVISPLVMPWSFLGWLGGGAHRPGSRIEMRRGRRGLQSRTHD